MHEERDASKERWRRVNSIKIDDACACLAVSDNGSRVFLSLSVLGRETVFIGAPPIMLKWPNVRLKGERKR